MPCALLHHKEQQVVGDSVGWAKEQEQDLEITAEGIHKEVKYMVDLERDCYIMRGDGTPAVNAQIAHTK